MKRVPTNSKLTAEEVKPSCRQGVVLIVVLVLVVMIALAGFGFLAEMTTEYEAARINGDLLQGQQMLASAESYLLTICEQRARTPLQIPQLQNAPHLFQAKALSFANLTTSVGDRSGLSEGRSSNSDTTWRFAVVADLPDVAARSATEGDSEFERAMDEDIPGDLYNTPLQFGLQNESSRLHLATVLEWESEEPGRGRRALLQIPDMTEAAADGILDWIDSDDDVREFGAESDHYSRLDRPYAARNSIPSNIEELLFVKGVSRGEFYGSPSTDIETGGLPADSSDTSGWQQYLTVVSAERNVDGTGQPRLRLNGESSGEDLGEGRSVVLPQKDLLELESRLQNFLPEDVARYLVLARMFGVLYSSSPGVTPSAIDLNSPEFRNAASSSSSSMLIMDLSDLIDSSVQLPSAVGGQLVKSPLRLQDLSSLSPFAILEDRLTTESKAVLSGRININTASETVLRALIEDPASASQLVQQRSGLDEAQRQSTLWLLTRQIVDLPTYRRIYRHLTTGGNVHTGEIIVYRPIGGPVLRRKVTIDAANEFARRLSWFDKSSLGLSIPIQQLEVAEVE